MGRRGGRGLLFHPQAIPLVQQYVSPNKALHVPVAAGGIFLVTLLVAYFITSKLSDMILDSRIGALDRTLGFAFGARAACCSPSSASCSSPGSPRTSGTIRSGCATPS